MIVPSKNQKTYGVLHTENYFSFLGFSKKVNSDEIQKVDVYLDDVLIDTIIADEHLQKIEDIYELEGFCFTYVLPYKYIGQKKIISFKNNETEENLLNSPYELINENHPKYNELRFNKNLKELENESETEKAYCLNSVGFLATENNLKDDDFMSYIKDFIKTFPQINFYGFYFEKEKIKKELWNSTLINSINDIENKVSILITNHISSYDKIIYESYHNHIAVVGFAGSNFSDKQIEDIKIESVITLFKENLNLFGLNLNDIDKYPNHLFLSSLVLTKKSDVSLLNILLTNQTFKEWQFNMINIGSNNLFFLKKMNFLRKNIKNLLKSKNK